MSYYAHFELSIIYGDKNLLEDTTFQALFEQVTTYEVSDVNYDSIGWYNYGADMIKISLAYPTTVFELYGDGEDSDDYWRAVFVNGKCEQVTATLEYPPIDIKSIANIGETHPEIFI